MSNSIKKIKRSILELSEEEGYALLEELYEYYPKTKDIFTKASELGEFSFIELLEYTVSSSIILWAKVYLNWTARDYQIPILEEMQLSKALVLRLGRRLGKTDCMCIGLLYFAYSQANKGPNGQYNILVLTPYETQIDLIFDRLSQLIQGSPFMLDLVVRDIEHRYELDNGTIVVGLTVGASAGSSGGNNTRGQRSD